MKTILAVTAAVLVAGGMGACKRAEQAKPEAEETQAKQAAPAPNVIESKGALAARREAQEHFDRARESFLQKDLATSAAELRAASKFLSERADSATGEVKERVVASARELDRLATEVEKSAIKSEKSLDYAFARAQRAEAERHHANAVAAWAKRDDARAGDELIMAADHLERGAKDAGQVLGTGVKKVLADTREVAGQLIKGVGFVPEQVGKVTEALGTEIRALGSKIEKRKA